MLRQRFGLALLLGVGLVACAERNKGPEITSSAGDASYAVQLPEEMERSNARYQAQGTGASEVTSNLGEFPGALDNPNWTIVKEVYERADAEGRSEAYVQHQREEAMLARFHDQERKPLVRRIAASNEYVAKEKGCEVELWGATDRGLEKALEERLEARRRANSEAHLLITREEESLGKKNQDPLRDQVDQIRFTSYVVHIGLPTEEAELTRQIDQASSAESTLSDHLEELKKQPKPNPEEIARTEQALKDLEPAVQRAQQNLDQAEQRRKDLAEKYEKAFDQLIQAVETAEDAQESSAK